MVELRESTPDDHDGFLRTVDQLLAVSNEIIDRLNSPAAPSEPTEPSGPSEPAESPEAASGHIGGDRPDRSGVLDRRAQEGSAGGAEDDTR